MFKLFECQWWDNRTHQKRNSSFILIQRLDPMSFKSKKNKDLLNKPLCNRISVLLINPRSPKLNKTDAQREMVLLPAVCRLNFFKFLGLILTPVKSFLYQKQLEVLMRSTPTLLVQKTQQPLKIRMLLWSVTSRGINKYRPGDVPHQQRNRKLSDLCLFH